jgi:hypothetical protein
VGDCYVLIPAQPYRPAIFYGLPAHPTKVGSPLSAQISSFPFTIYTDLKAQVLRSSILTLRHIDNASSYDICGRIAKLSSSIISLD